jgi:hypothetical protein
MAGRTNGHPAIRVNGRVVLARRHYWAQKHGMEPKARFLDLVCGNANCVNPEHCRERKKRPPRKVHLSHADRRKNRTEIRMLKGCEKREIVARMYGISPDYVSILWSPSTW